MKNYSTSFVFIFLALFSVSVKSQNKVLDSIHLSIQQATTDTARMSRLNDLSWEHLLIGNADSAIKYAEKALSLAELTEGKEGLKAKGRSYSNIAMGTSDKGDFAGSISYFLKTLKIGEELNNEILISSTLANLGNVYGSIGEYDKGLDCLFRAMKLSEKMGNKKMIANDLGNIGNLYDLKNEQEKALEYYTKALELCKELNYKYGLAANLGNMGLIYQRLGEFEKSITHYMQALILAKETGDQQSVAVNEGNLGELYVQMIPSASSADKRKYADHAESHLKNALAIDTLIKFRHHQESVYHSLSELFTITGDHKRSLENYKLYVQLKDSIFNEEKNKEVARHEMTYEFEKKEAALKAEQDKKEATAESDKMRRTIFMWLILFVTLAIATIAVIVIRSLKFTRKQKLIIEEQKEMVEEKQKEVLDSIRYAKRIQKSLLPTEKYISKNLNRLNQN